MTQEDRELLLEYNVKEWRWQRNTFFCTYPLDDNSKISKRIGDDIMDVLSTIDQDEIEYREC